MWPQTSDFEEALNRGVAPLRKKVLELDSISMKGISRPAKERKTCRDQIPTFHQA